MNNVVVVPGGQARDTATHIHVSIPLHTPLTSRLPHNTEQSSLYGTVGPRGLPICIIAVCTRALFQSPAKVVACTLNSVGLSAPLHPSPSALVIISCEAGSWVGRESRWRNKPSSRPGASADHVNLGGCAAWAWGLGSCPWLSGSWGLGGLPGSFGLLTSFRNPLPSPLGVIIGTWFVLSGPLTGSVPSSPPGSRAPPPTPTAAP